MPHHDVPSATVADISRALSEKETSSIALTRGVIDLVEDMNPAFNAFSRVTAERALAEARASDKRRSVGAAIGPLDGIPYAVKDLFDVRDEATVAGSSLLSNHMALADSHAVRCLCDAGMVLIGKTHTVPFGCHIDGINREFGTPHNPWHKDPHLPGGSSSGSAVAVASGMVPVALGTDTGGSVRVPAALTGITGFKPSVGRIGRGGMRPLCWSLDTVGLLSRNAQDAAMLFDVLQGHDPTDETTWAVETLQSTEVANQGLDGVHVVVCDTLFFDDAQADVINAVDAVQHVLRELGAKVSYRRFDEVVEALKLANDSPFQSEAFAVNRDVVDHHRDMIAPDGLWMDTGDRHSATEYYWALRQRFALQRSFVETLDKADAVLAPTCAQVAWPIAALESGDLPPARYSRNTSVANVLNLPSVSLPCGLAQSGLPIGAMLSAAPFNDAAVLQIARAVQSVTDWHCHAPSQSPINAAAIQG